MTETKTLVTDCLGEFGFRVRFTYADHWCDVEAFRVEARETNGAPCFLRRDARSSPDWVSTIDEAQPYVTGLIKWDGCSEFDWCDNHLCGPSDYLAFFGLLEYAYRRAQSLMACGNFDPWPTASSAPPTQPDAPEPSR